MTTDAFLPKANLRIGIVVTIICCGLQGPAHTAAASSKPCGNAYQLVIDTSDAFAKSQDRVTARSGYLKATEIEPRCAAAWFNLGTLLEADHDWIIAKPAFEHYLQLAPNGRYLKRAQAELEIVTGYLKLSPSAREAAVKSDDYDADIQRARTFSSNGLYKEAIAESARAQALDDSRWESYAVVCLVMARQGKVSDATKFRDMALARTPASHKSEIEHALTLPQVAP